MSIAVPLYGFGASGGGAYTGPKVIGSPTQPSNPKDNTVWVQTSTPISSWEMSEVAVPGWDTAPTGFVYFTTSTSDWTVPNLVRFVKRNEGNVFLKATRCWQNLGTPGATQWTSMNAYIYHNDTWTQFSTSRSTPEFTYTGDYEIVDDSNNTISNFATWTGNWKIRFLTSGTLTFTSINGAIDVFLVGGGGSRAASNNSGWDGYAGGGSGYTTTSKNIQVTVGTPYSITVGAKDSSGTSSGGASTAFGSTANGGQSGLPSGVGGKGGSGGGGAPHINHNGVDSLGWDSAGAGNGGTNGSNGTKGYYSYGAGQGTTTREFGEASAKRYAAGGPGVGTGNDAPNGTMGTVDVSLENSGSAGYSGIVIIRNARGAA